MSKKETRRAARQAFPKAKNAATAKKSAKAGVYTRQTGGNRSRPAPGARVPKPPSMKRSLIWGIVWAAVYFVVITWVWKSSNATLAANALFSLIGVFLFGGVFYFVDWFKYRRYIRGQKGSSK